MRTHRLAGFALVAGVLVAGCDQSPVVSPAHTDAPDLAAARGNSPVVEQDADAVATLGVAPAVTGSAVLTRTTDGVSMEAALTGLEDGHAFTFWFVTFDNPEGCKGTGPDTGCGADDVPRASAQARVVNGGGDVADVDPVTGVAVVKGHLARHNAEGAQMLGGTDASPLSNPYRAEIHVIVRSHGPAEADLADLAEQTSNVIAFCNLEPVGVAPVDAFGCMDQGVIIFGPGDQPPGQR